MDLVGSRWVIHKSEDHDSQKQKYKAHIVCKGFHETEKPQSDSPTVSQESLLVQTAIATNLDFRIWAIDITPEQVLQGRDAPYPDEPPSPND